jgi:hypothetical protein
MAIWRLWDELTSRPVWRVAVDIDVCNLLFQACETNPPTPTVRVLTVDRDFRRTGCNVAVCLLWVGMGGRVTVDLLLFVLPVFEFACVLDILF